MKGIRKKITTGFLVLIILLLFSGMVSFFELARLTRRTEAILESSSHNIELSKRMLDAVEQQNSSLLERIVLRTSNYDSLFVAGGHEFDAALTEAAGIGEIRTELDTIVMERNRYRDLAGRFYDETYDTDLTQFLSTYKSSYNDLTAAVKAYMTTSQYSLETRAIQLESNAYRAIMPAIITLVVAIAIILVFMFLIELYYTRPILKIQKSLGNYLKHNIPYNVTVESKDEIARLNEDIETLITANKNKRPE